MSLLNPLFLLGLSAIALPVIVHLVRRTKAPRIEFPSLMFVRRVPQRTIRRRQLQNLLLLIMRCLAFLLVALAFVRPYFGGSQAEINQQQASLIMLDTSFSMRYGPRFEQARERARAIINQTGGRDRIALMTFGQSYEIQSRFTTDANQVRAILAGLPVGAGGTDYVQALRGAEGLFKEVSAGRKEIFLISDFQAAGRNPAEAAYRLSPELKLNVINVGEPSSPNLAVTEAGAQPLIYQPKYTDKVTVRIANHSDDQRSGVPVEFELNDRMVEKREIQIPARETATVEFTGFNLNEGANRAVIKIEGDSFPFDNRFYLTLRRADQLKALVLDSATRGRDESFYLRSALTTGENLPFNVEVKSAASVNPAELNGYRVIIVNDVGGLGGALTTQIVKFVENGGGLIISAGPHTEAKAFNQAWQKLTPATLEEAVQLRGDYVAMSEIKTDHPIFEIFRQSGRLAAAKVFGYHRAKPGEQASVLARFEDGSPALIEASHGSGKTLLFTSTFDASWNDLPLTPIYLPLVRQMTRHLGEREERAWHQLGESFAVPATKDGTPPAIDAPNGERVTDRKQTSMGEWIIDAREPGFYRLRYPNRPDFAAVDLDGKESDLTPLKVDEFVASVTGADPKATAAAVAGERVSNEELESRQRVWWVLLIAALLLFVAEAVLARRTKMTRVIG